MTVITKPIGRLPINKGNWDASFVNPKTGIAGYGKKFRAIRYGCELESKIENNTYDPITWDGADDFTIDTTHWLLVSGNPQNWLAGQDKPAASEQYPYNGMGRITLKKNMVSGVNTLTQSMMQATNTIYVIQYDFTLGEDITIPANCVLEFDGGSISGQHTLTGNNTQINAQNVVIFKSGIIIAGTWVCPCITSSWFNDVTNDNRIKQVFNLSNSLIQNEIVIEEGVYNVSASTEKEHIITLNSNTVVNLLGEIKVAANALEECNVFGIYNSNNIIIRGKGIIQGDKETHTGSTGQGGTGIEIEGSQNIVIKGITCKDFWGDGIYIGGWRGLNKDIVVCNVVINNARRTGIAITWAENVIISNCRISNIEGHLTEFGIDIEPNTSCVVYNVTIDNVLFDTKNGVQLIGGDAEHSIAVKNVSISQCRFINSRIPFRSRRSDNATIENCDITINQSIQDYSEESLNIILCAEAINTIIRNNTIKCTSAVGYLFDVRNCGKDLLIEHNVIDTVGNLLTGQYSTPKFIRNKISTSIWIFCDISTLYPYFYENSITSPYPSILRGKNFHIEKNKIICTGDTTGTIIWLDNEGKALYNVINCKKAMSDNDAIIASRGDNQQVIGNNIIIDDITGADGAGIRFSGSNSLGGYNTITAGLESVLYKWSGAFINIGTNALKSGNTASRPTNYVLTGFQYFDTTLGKPIYWNGTAWVDATGTPV